MAFNKTGETKVFKKAKKDGKKTASEQEQVLISDLIKEDDEKEKKGDEKDVSNKV
jgi:hypothetical protein